ncbi:MAG: C_GCAxxG_C_C family protein, partial [Chloroflexi bacterium]|nr:C_GCAxxG_C_C family protein [Chloroflexota bacterium]
FAPDLGLSEESAIKIAAAFGGGMARQGEVCGAVSGALMALGLKYGHASPENRDEVNGIGGTFMRRFEERNGSILCRELLGCAIDTPEGLQQARERGVFAAVCPKAVRVAAQLVAESLDSGK